jgi:hypothetical protein
MSSTVLNAPNQTDGGTSQTGTAVDGAGNAIDSVTDDAGNVITLAQSAVPAAYRLSVNYIFKRTPRPAAPSRV